jgi:diguanylate cyclase (GGDEF)-like protein/PAS domain S-box-containing protein
MGFLTSRIYLMVGAVAVGGYFLLSDFAQNLGYIVIGASAVVAILLGALRHRPDKSLPWYTIACGILMFVVGDAIWAYHEGIRGAESPFPSAADGFYLAGYPLLAGGLALMVGFRTPRHDRIGLIDAAIITVGAGLMLWVFFMEPYVDDRALSLSERLISISYPLGDLLLIALAVRLIFAPGHHRPAYYLLTSSLMLLLFTDIFYAELVLMGSYEFGSPLDAGWLLSYLLLGAAALHPSMRSLSDIQPIYTATLVWTRWVLLGAALSTAPVALVIQAFLRNHIDVPLIVGAWAVLILLTLLRTAIIFRSRERAVSRERILRDASAALVKAPDRERIYAATLEAVLPFIKEASGTRVSVWSGSTERDRCVGAAGHRAEDIRGKETYINDFPDWLRTPLLEGEIAELKPGQPTEIREAFGFATKVGAIFMVPLIVQSQFVGRIAVASDSELPEDIRYVLETLGSQVALALERVSLDEELHRRQSDERFRKLVQNSSDVVTVYEADGTVRYISPGIERMLGYKPEERIGANGFETIHPDDLPQIKRAFAEALPRPGATVSIEARARHRDGSWRYIEAVGTNLLGDPDLHAVVLNSRDITGRKQAEEELRKSEARNRAIVEAYPDLMFRVNRDGEYLDFQTNDDNKLYVRREKIIGNNIRDTLPSDVAAGALRHLDRALETGSMQFYEYQLPMSEGLRDFEARFVATDEDEALCIIRDVTQRKALEEALRESEERFRTIFEQTAVGVSIADPQRRLLETNAAYQEMTGYSEEELFNKPIAEISHPDDVPADDELHRELLSGRVERYQREKRYIRKDGEIVWVILTVSAVRDAEGRPRFLIGVVEDITERKRAEERLRESEERFRQLFEQSVDTLLVHDEEGRILDCNSEACRTLVYTREELLSLRIKDIANGLLSEEEKREREKAGGTLWQRVVRGEPIPPVVVHYGEHIRKDGTTFPIEVHVGSVDYEGRRRILASVHDISERREAERRLQESEQRYRSLFDHNPDAVYSFDLEGNFLTANAACEKVAGYAIEELLQMSFIPLIVPEDLERTLQGFERAASGEPQNYEIAITHKDGHRVELNVTNLPILVAGEIVGVYGIAKDITERKRYEDALKESEERFRTAFEDAPIGVALVDLDGRRLKVNRALCEMLGYSEEELLGRDYLEVVHPDDREISTEHFRPVLEAGAGNYMLERRYIRADGDVVWNLTSVSLLQDARGNPSYFICLHQDITERKRAEELLQRQSAAIESSIDGMAILDRQGTYTYVNEAQARIYGYDEPEQLLGESWRVLYGEEQLVWFDQHVNPILGERGSWRGEAVGRRRNGSEFPQELSLTILEDGGYVCVVHDITERKRAEEARFRLAAIVESSDDAIFGNTLEGIITSWNPGAERLYGYSADEILGKHISILFPPERQSEVSKVLEKIGHTGEINSYETVRMAKDGRRIYVSVTVSPVRDSSGNIIGTSGIVRDITERKRAEERLRKSEARNRAMIEATPDLIFLYSRDGEYLDLQANAPSKLYLPREELLGSKLQDVLPPEVADPFVREIDRTLDTGEMQVYEYQLDVPEGALDFEARLVVSGPEEVLCAVRDITERKDLERQLSYQAFHDSLTGLPNRLLFMEHLERALARARRQGNRVGVLFMDIDNFKYVNDSLGHEAGDQLLTWVAERLREAVRPGDTVARLGGDELTVLLEEVADAREATRVAERIEKILRAPLTLEGREVFVGVSIGIALSSSAHDQSERLLSHADLAMYRAKNKGKAQHAVFTPGMETVASNRLQLASELRRAVDQGEMRVCYQPKVRLGTDLQQQEPKVVQEGRIIGMEALVRWEHPELGTVGPEDFITTAEETGLILPIGHRVLEEACRQARAWQEQYPADPPLVMCVNLSARQFQQPELAQNIARMLQEIGLDPRCLQLEITESVVMEEVESTLNILRELRDLGVSLAIDDFGTGYSSLSYLKRFPVDSLKIDRSFVEGIEKDSENAVIVSGIITLAHTLGIQVIAEGVETADQAAHLRQIGCDLAQGNHFSEPLPGEAAGELLARNQSTHS